MGIERNRRRILGLKRVWKFPFETTRNRAYVTARLFQGHPRAQTADRPVIVGRAAVVIIESRIRDPQLALRWKVEAGGHDADDRTRHACHADRPSQDGRVRAVCALPQTLADQHR